MERIAIETANVTEGQLKLAEPECAPQPRDHVVGTADIGLRRLFYLYRHYRKRMAETMAELELCAQAERDQKISDLLRFKAQSEVLNDIFWISCRTAAPELWGKDLIGIRKGWQLVWMKSGEEISMEDVLQGFSRCGDGTMPLKPKLN